MSKKDGKKMKKGFVGLLPPHALDLGLSAKFGHCSMHQSKVRD